MYENKKVEELVKAFSDKGMYSAYESDDSYVCADDMVFFDKVCSAEVLDTCINIVRTAESAEDAWDKLSSSGMLNCTPKLVNNRLVFGFQKYMHWFRGCYYQTSYTYNGIGSREHTYFRLDYALTGVGNKLAVEQLLTAAALATALRYYKQTMKMLSSEEGVKEFEGLVRSDIAKHHKYIDPSDYSVSCLLDLVTVETSKHLVDEPAGEGTKVVQLNTKGALYLSKERVRVTTQESGLYVMHTLTVPEWVWSGEDDDCLYFEDKHPNHIMELLVEFMLAYSGIRLGILGIFSMVDRKSAVKVNCPCIASNVEDVYDIVSNFYKDKGEC
jgi:hypothetical protein